MSRRGWMLLRATMAALALVLWPTGAFAAEACEALNPKACMDNFLHYSFVQLIRAIWFFDRPLLLVARWIEGLRAYLVEGVLATAFDATIAGVRAPFWMMAATAWCVFVISYMVSMIADFRWVNLRRGIWYCALAALLFQWGSQALAASEGLRATVGQGFSQLAQQSVEESGTPLSFFASNDGSMQRPHPIYGGDADCPGVPTKRDDAGAMYLNDYAANYLWADARDIHCPTATGGSSELPRVFAKGDGSFQGYVPKEQIDTEEEGERTRLIALAQDGVMRMALGLLMALGALLEQSLYLLFTLALATAWIGLLISLLFVLFVSGESMFTSQIRAGVNILRASWLASIWIGIMLAIVRQAASTGNGMVVVGAAVLMVGIIVWQLTGAFALLMSTLDQVGNGVLGGAPAALGAMAQKVAGGVMAVASGGGSLALAAAGGAVAAQSHRRGWEAAGGGETGQESGSGAFGVGAALSRARPLRRAGQLAKAMGLVSDADPLIAGLTRPRAADPFAWANTRRDRASGKEEAQRVIRRRETERPAEARRDGEDEGFEVPHPPKGAQSQEADGASPEPPRGKGAARTAPRAAKASSPAQQKIGGIQQTPKVQAAQIGALATALTAGREPAERDRLVEQVRPLAEQFYQQTGRAPHIDPLSPPRIGETRAGGVEVKPVDVHDVRKLHSVSEPGAVGQRGYERRPPFRFVQRSAPADTGEMVGDDLGPQATEQTQSQSPSRYRGRPATKDDGKGAAIRPHMSHRTRAGAPAAQGDATATAPPPSAASIGQPSPMTPSSIDDLRSHSSPQGRALRGASGGRHQETVVPELTSAETSPSDRRNPPVRGARASSPRTTANQEASPASATHRPADEPASGPTRMRGGAATFGTPAPVVARDVAAATIAVPTAPAAGPPPAAPAPATPSPAPTTASIEPSVDAASTPRTATPATGEVAHARRSEGVRPALPAQMPTAAPAAPDGAGSSAPKAARRPWASRPTGSTEGGRPAARAQAALPRATKERKRP